MYSDVVNVYTLEQVAELLGVDTDGFEEVLVKVSYPKKQPVRYQLKTPLDVGEKQKAKIVGYIPGHGYGFFPSVASFKLWVVDEPENWTPNAVA